MPVSVSVKGIHEGLLITLPEGNWEEAFPSLLEHLDSKPDFFSGAKAILQLEGYDLHAADLAGLRGALADRGMSLKTVLSGSEATRQAARSLGIETALPKREAREAPFETELQGSEAILLQQTLRSGNSIHFPGHVVVLGDVNPGAEIFAGGSVVVWGRLRGTVHAGARGDERSVVCAMDLSPMQLRIGAHVATSPPRRGKPQPETAFLREGQLVAEPWSPKDKTKSGKA
ncbi:MAG: septum site-determining protein MinC [Anaerolineales bacterium]|nr:septum site-determining protein MinC [Anaerolineales bacterium]